LTTSLNVPVLPAWLLSPEYVAVIPSVPTGSVDVVHVAVPGLPDVTVDALHPVLPLHATVPVTFRDFACPFRPFTSPYCPLIVAVNVTDCPEIDGLALEVTTVAAVA
jgi:hypothetical protein